MPKAIKNIPDLTGFTNFQEYLNSNPPIKISSATFTRAKSKQIKFKVNNQLLQFPTDARNTQRSILVDKDSKQLLSEEDLKTIEALDEKDNLKPEIRRNLINKAIRSLDLHIPTQWQAAMTALERLLPQHFAKRDGNTPLTNAIGIRITIGAREKQAQEVQAEVRTVPDSEVKIDDVK
jgi:hypothetical protein